LHGEEQHVEVAWSAADHSPAHRDLAARDHFGSG
jgi:hypothetical protein